MLTPMRQLLLPCKDEVRGGASFQILQSRSDQLCNIYMTESKLIFANLSSAFTRGHENQWGTKNGEGNFNSSL